MAVPSTESSRNLTRADPKESTAFGSLSDAEEPRRSTVCRPADRVNPTSQWTPRARTSVPGSKLRRSLLRDVERSTRRGSLSRWPSTMLRRNHISRLEGGNALLHLCFFWVIETSYLPAFSATAPTDELLRRSILKSRRRGLRGPQS